MAKRKTAKKRPSRKNFLSRVQNTPKMKSIRNKIKKLVAAKKKLSVQYKRTLKSESKRLG